METQDLKTEIQKALDQVPKYVLQDVLAYLRQIENSSDKTIARSNNLKRILIEDSDLLKRLAE